MIAIAWLFNDIILRPKRLFTIDTRPRTKSIFMEDNMSALPESTQIS